MSDAGDVTRIENDEISSMNNRGFSSEGAVPYSRSPLRCIRAKCIDCSGGVLREVELCPCDDCPLWVFRMGKNPYRKKREMSDEQREEFVNRMRKMREMQ